LPPQSLEAPSGERLRGKRQAWCLLVMARYSHKGHDTIQYDIAQNIAIWYYTIRSESASPYVRTASKHATAQPHTTGAPSFCLSTLSPLQVPGYWPSGEATVVGDRWGDRRPAAGVPWSPGLFSRATVSTGRQTVAAVETLHSCYCLAAARLAGSHTAQMFSDCAITKYLSRATAFTVDTCTHPGGRAITAN